MSGLKVKVVRDKGCAQPWGRSAWHAQAESTLARSNISSYGQYAIEGYPFEYVVQKYAAKGQVTKSNSYLLYATLPKGMLPRQHFLV